MLYDCIIIGAGPAGLAAAYTLNGKTLLLDKGKNINQRTSLTSGFGGCGTFSDGKLIVSDVVGGNLNKYTSYDLNKVIDFFKKFTTNIKYYQHQKSELTNKAIKLGINLVATDIYHMGTDGCLEFSKNIYNELKNKVEILLETKVTFIEKGGDKFHIVDSNDKSFYCKYLILAPGRGGSEWLEDNLHGLGLNCTGNEVDLGLRIEVRTEVVQELLDFSRDFKLIYHTKCFDDKVRSFCVNLGGFVVKEETDHLISCNGHSYSDKQTENTNFALLVSIPFTDPIDPILYGKSLVSLVNNISDGVIVQRYGDLIKGRRSTPKRINMSIVKPTLEAYAGDHSLYLPFRYLLDLIETIETMDKLVEGVGNDDTLLYGLEIKFLSNKVKLDKNMETEIPNLFVAGDCSGVSRGITQAAATGFIASNEINKRL